MKSTPIHLCGLVLVFVSLINFYSFGQCSTDGIVDIPDLQPISANLVVEGAINNDLSTSQGVCGIALEFEHNQVGDLTIQLTSPEGQTVTLLGPTGSFGNTAYTSWDVLFVPCGQSASPDAGFTDKWNNNQNWGLLGNYAGSYFPYLGCLEDFNTGSVNGIWSIQILDNTLFDQGQLISGTIFFCEQEGLSCLACDAKAGEFTDTEINLCANNASSVEPSVTFPDGESDDTYNYYYVVRQGDNINEISETLDFSSYTEGVYEVCGFSISTSDVGQIASLASMTYSEFQENVEGVNPSICGDISNVCTSINLSSAPTEVDLNITICDGDSYAIGGNNYSIPDTYQVIIENSNSCDSIVNLTLNTVTIQALANASTTVLTCSEPELQLSGALSNKSNNSDFYWSTSGGGIVGSEELEEITINQAGSYTFNVVDGLCLSTSTIQISASDETPELIITGETITCSNPEVLIDLESTSILTSIAWTGPNGFTASTEDITVTEAGVYSVTVISNNGCQGSKSIIINEAGDIPILQLSANDISCSLPQVIIQTEANSNSLTYSWTGPNGFTSEAKNPLVIEAGVYEVTATDPFGCSDIFSIEVFGDANILDYTLNYSDITCPNSNIAIELIIADLDATVEWIRPDGTKVYGLSILSNQAGMYTVNIVSNGCVASEIFTVNQDFDDLPTVNITQSNLVNCDDPTAILTAEILTNGENIDHVNWFLSGYGQVGDGYNVEANLSGQYAFYIHMEDGCRLRFNYILEFGAGLPPATVTSTNISCKTDFGGIQAVSTGNYDYSWTGPGGYTSQDSFDVNVEAGLYHLTVTDQVGCTREYYTIVSTDTVPVDLALTASGELNCDNDSITISPDGIPLTNISWTSNTGFTSNDNSVKVDEPGFYYVVAEGVANGCISYDTLEVTKDISIPDIQTEDQSFNCGETVILLDAESETVGATFSWEGPGGFVSNFKNPLASEAGPYTLTVTGTNGCIATQVISVVENNVLPDVSASFSNDLDCIDTQSDIIGSTTTSDVTFKWEGPNSFVSDQPVVTVENPGEYIFFVTGMNGCTDSVSFDLPFTGAYPEFNALGDTLFCGDLENLIDVNSITTNVTYSWVGPNGYSSDNEMNAVVDSGMYILTGVGLNSCVSLDTAFVVFDNQPADLMVGLYDTLDCNLLTQEVSISADKTFTSIHWTGPNGFDESTQNIDVTEGGTYTFTGISANNCESTVEVEVAQNIALPIFTLDAEDINCDNNKADITLDNADAGATYSWSGTNYTSDLQNPVVEQEGTYSVTVTGSNGCESTDMILVIADLEDPSITVKDDTLPCDGSPIHLFLETTTSDATFQWIGPAGFDSTTQNPLADIPGTYFIEVIAPNGCSTNEEINLNDIPVFPKFELAKSNNITCDTRLATLNALEVDDDKSFAWTGPNNFTSSESEFVTEESGTYYITVEGITGCIEIDSIVVDLDTIYPLIVLNQAGRLLCDINDPKVNGIGSSVGVDFDYQWTTDDGEITFGENTLEPLIKGKGTYRLYVEDESNGCGFFREIEVKEEESTLATVDLSYVIQTCSDINDGVINVIGVEGGEAPYRYAIEGTSFTQNGLFEGLESGIHLVSVKDSFGCVLDTLVDLEAKKTIEVDLGDDLSISLGQEVNLKALTNFPTNEISTITWTPSEIIDCLYCLDYDFMPSENLQVSIVVTDEDGCITTDQIIIRVDEDINLYVPNIFSPNNDGINDVWFMSESKNIEIINYFNVYDRWGSKVFSDTGDNNRGFIPGQGKSWDGKHNGNQVMQGAYVYISEVVLVNGKTKIMKGNITVIR